MIGETGRRAEELIGRYKKRSRTGADVDQVGSRKSNHLRSRKYWPCSAGSVCDIFYIIKEKKNQET